MKYLLLLICLTVSAGSRAQAPYWQQELDYRIQVTLGENKTLSAYLDLSYTNHSPDTLNIIWFHIWPNAYRNEATALYKQMSADKELKKKIRKAARGWIDSLNFTVDSKPSRFELDKENPDIGKLLLPAPLQPGQSCRIQTPFFVQLPPYISRSGYNGNQYMICQWYPKPAVYDRKGWHTFPYLDQGEFYGDFGNYSVSISLPANYVVGATGTLTTAAELAEYKRTGTLNRNAADEKFAFYSPANWKQAIKTLTYEARNVHDFAWFASPDAVIRYDTLQLASGSNIDVFSYARPEGNAAWKNSTDFIKDAIRHYSRWLGEYPYPVVQAVEGPSNESSGGMEYPMITLITSPGADATYLDAVITHEVGHNWFYGILGTNERDQPWMDEGLNTFYQFRYEAEKYRANSVFGRSLPEGLRKLDEGPFLEIIYKGLNNLPAKQPVNTSSAAFPNKEEYSTVVYLKTAIWFFILENAIGRAELDKGMQAYFREWKFRHPDPEDLKAVLEKSSGMQLNAVFDLLNQSGNFR